MYLESTTHVEATPVAKNELMTLADAVAILIELRNANKSQTEGTETAVTQLGRFLRPSSPALTDPTCSWPRPTAADTQVLGVLQEVLAEFNSKVSVFDWHEIADAGAITSQIADRIVRSPLRHLLLLDRPHRDRARLCRQPERDIRGRHAARYDQRARRAAVGLDPGARGRLPPAPFDFADQRIERVPRDPETARSTRSGSRSSCTAGSRPLLGDDTG